ncbi:zf-HC2 domain-containing protein [bacterium]|nr:zf-HC2 domain-containing protein [bacterium]MBP9806958.1 zf-HC2 domain-containing protein [bacterium]
MQGQPNLNCKQMEEALDAYYDLELGAEEAEAVELHLADCAICTARLADIDVVVNQLKNLPAVEWSGDLSDAIEARILAQASSPEAKVEPNVENIVSINSGFKSQAKLQPQSNARSSKVTDFFKPRYILASAASILALFFAYSQFASTPNTVTEVAQTAAPEVLPVAKELTPKLKVETVRQVASTPEKKDSVATTKLEAIKVASKPDLQTPPKVAIENTATKKMLANSKQGTSDHNSNNVNDSEEIVAVYDYDTIDSVSDFGISTNEDGLYAIKL